MQTIKTIDRLFYRELGTQLRNIRQHREMTLLELSQQTGYSRPLIDHWELGLNKIKPKQLERLCDALNVSSNLKIEIKVGLWLLPFERMKKWKEKYLI